MTLALPSSLSPSKLTAFKDCPKAFQFSNVDRLPEASSRHLVLGTLVHRALEFVYEEMRGLRKSAAFACLYSAWVQIWEDPDYQALELDTNGVLQFYADAENLLANALKLEDPDSVDVRSTEQMLEAVVDGVLLRGKIDRLDNLPGGGFGVVDYKTGRVPSQTSEREKMLGVHFYAFLCEQVFGRLPEWIRLDYLADPVSVTCIPTEQSVRGLRNRAGAVWAAIEAACANDDFRPRQSRLCSWCSYQAICPLFGGTP